MTNHGHATLPMGSNKLMTQSQTNNILYQSFSRMGEFTITIVTSFEMDPFCSFQFKYKNQERQVKGEKSLSGNHPSFIKPKYKRENLCQPLLKAKT